MMTRLGVIILIFTTWAHALPVDKEVDVLRELLDLTETLDRPSRRYPVVSDGYCDYDSPSNYFSNTPEFIRSNARGIRCGTKFSAGGGRYNSYNRPREVVLDLLQRIVGGAKASQNEYPWMVAEIPSSSGEPECGGTLITDQWVLTAAHCFTQESENGEIQWENDPADWTFKVMANNAVDLDDGIEEYAQTIVIHESYDKDSDSYEDDVALVKLCSPIPGATPVCLPDYDPAERFNLRHCTVTGWGKTSQDGPASPMHLREVDVTVYDPANPRPGHGPCTQTNRTLCASGEGKDSCQGDSGGPLVCGSRYTSNVQIGVVSHGTGACAAKGHYGVYANTFQYQTWIRHILDNY